MFLKFIHSVYGVPYSTRAPMKVKFGAEESNRSTIFLANFHFDRCNVSAMRGKRNENSTSE